MSDIFGVYTQSLADADLKEAILRRIREQRLAQFGQVRDESLLSGRENMSSRGMLHSGVALQDIAKRNQAVDQEIGSTNQAFQDDIMGIQNNRLSAEAAYQYALAEKAKATAAATPTFDPTDPYNWKGIAAAMPPQEAAPPADDPYNWKAIDEQIRSGQIADPRLQAQAPKIQQPKPKPKPVVAPKVTTKPVKIPAKGYY